MAFRINSPIDSNQHKGILGLNSVNGKPLALTGLSLTNAQPLHVAVVDGSGNQITSFGSLVPTAYDAITYTNTSGTVDTYKYYVGGTGGTLVATLTVTWTDSSKIVLTSVVRT